MLRFIVKRLAVALGVLFAATFLFFVLAANSGDALKDLRTSNQKNREELMAARTAELNLDVPVAERYFLWLGDAVQGDLGRDYKTGQPVTEMLTHATGQTLKLIGFASVTAIVLGASIGVISALRQYSGFDYGVTILNFFMFSLPSFWVAVLLKQWGAIGFNNYLADPSIPPVALLFIALVLALAVGSAVGGTWRSRLIAGGGVGAVTIAVLWYLSTSGWFDDPGLNPAIILILGVGAALALTFLAAGLANRRALLTALTVATLGAVAWFPFQTAFKFSGQWESLAEFVGFVVAGIAIGVAFGGPDRKVNARVGGMVGVVMFGLLWLDNLMSYWIQYTSTSAINGRPIATVGSSTPEFAGNTNYWVATLDTYTHIILPITALILISLAGYTRYMRGTMLEVMNLDYIRTARAKGLPERTVVMRHGLRNALIPFATIIPIDLAALVGGAVITETVFGWNGMGRLFINALYEVNTNVMMGYFLVTGVLLVIGNVVADVLYAVLDPRIRVDA